MKSLLLSFLLSFVAISSLQAQANDTEKIVIDPRLNVVFDQAYLARLQTDNPFLLQRWNFYLDHAWYLTNNPKEKGNVTYPSIKIADLHNINILLLEKEQHIAADWKKQVIYQIEGSDQLLVYYPRQDFQQALNQHLKRKQTDLKRSVRL